MSQQPNPPLWQRVLFPLAKRWVELVIILSAMALIIWMITLTF